MPSTSTLNAITIISLQGVSAVGGNPLENARSTPGDAQDGTADGHPHGAKWRRRNSGSW